MINTKLIGYIERINYKVFHSEKHFVYLLSLPNHFVARSRLFSSAIPRSHGSQQQFCKIRHIDSRPNDEHTFPCKSEPLGLDSLIFCRFREGRYHVPLSPTITDLYRPVVTGRTS